MRTIVFLAAATIATNMAAAAAATPVKPDVASARAYVQGLYNRYERDDSFGVFGDQESEFFDASTLALLRQNEKLLNGEEGAIFVDYICACQDAIGMHATIGNVAMTGTNAAEAYVAVQFAGNPVTHVTIDLAFEKGAWRLHDIAFERGARLHDIHDKGRASNLWGGLRDVLTKEIAELSAHH